MRGVTGLALATALAAAAAPAQTPAPSVAPPRAFSRIVWVEANAPPELLARIRAAGFDAVNLGRGGDAAAVRAAGLGFYCDQPAGKGLLELRDAEWKPVAEEFERTRALERAVRPTCLQDEAAVEAACVAAAEEAARQGPEGMRFVALADEASATRHGAPSDVCRCPRCELAFRSALQRAHASLEELNTAWGTTFACWDDVTAAGTDAIRRRELGEKLLPANLRPWSDRLAFVDRQLAAAVRAMAARVQAVVPGVPVGLTGLQPPAAFGGHDLAQHVPYLHLLEPYEVGAAPALCLGLLPAGAHRYVTIAAPPADAPPRWATARLADAAAHGLAGAVVWNAAAVFGADGKPSAFGGALAQAFAELNGVLDACAGATVQPASVWLVESQPSVRAWWMLDSAADKATWVRRLASYEASHSTSQAARLGWTRLLQDLGLQPRFVAEPDLPERLLQERPRCLVLPAAIALADRTCQAIAAYVRAGGTVVADHTAALYDEHLVRRAAGGLDDVFGITARSFANDDLRVREGRALDAPLRSGACAAERGLEGALADRSGGAPVSLEQRSERGRAVYLNLAVCDYDRARLDPKANAIARDLRVRVRAVLQQAGVDPPCEVRGEGLPTCIERVPLRLRDGRAVLAIRVHALDRPGLLAELAKAGPKAITVAFPREVRLRRLGGDDLGAHDKFALQLDPFAGMFLEVAGR